MTQPSRRAAHPRTSCGRQTSGGVTQKRCRPLGGPRSRTPRGSASPRQPPALPGTAPRCCCRPCSRSYPSSPSCPCWRRPVGREQSARGGAGRPPGLPPAAKLTSSGQAAPSQQPAARRAGDGGPVSRRRERRCRVEATGQRLSGGPTCETVIAEMRRLTRAGTRHIGSC